MQANVGKEPTFSPFSFFLNSLIILDREGRISSPVVGS